MLNEKARIGCNLIPIPKELSILPEGKLEAELAIFTSEEAWQPLVDVFCDAAKKIFGVEVENKKGGIELTLERGIKAEAYSIRIENSIIASASDYNGARYALVSLLQLAEVRRGKFFFDKLLISDYPDKDYRGFFIDVAREWHPIETLFKYVDVCYFYKIKYIELHFMDNEGYTFTSKAFPKLSKDGKVYTVEQIKALNAYARERGVIIIPDIEMPGHVRILNECYPEIFANKHDEEPKRDEYGEISADTALCVGSEVTYNACITIINEVLEMFGDIDYLGITGDEVASEIFDGCSICREYMREHNIKDGHELCSEFLGRIVDYVISLGITPVVSEGFPKEYAKYISKKSIVLSWENYYHIATDLLECGYRVINMSWKPLYILKNPTNRWGMEDILDWNVYEWKHWWPSSKAHLNRICVPATEQVIGAQFCTFEQTFESEVSFVLENVTAFAEKSWSIVRYRSFDEFLAVSEYIRKKCYRLII